MVGVDISDRSIKIAEVSKGLQAELLTVGWQPIQDSLIRRGVVLDVSGMSEMVRAAISSCSIPLSDVLTVASIPEVQSFVRVIEVPAMSPEEMNEAVYWAIRQHIPFDLDRVYLDWQPLPTPARSLRYQQVLVGAARRDVIDPLLAVFDATELEIVALELETQAVVRSLLPRNATDVRGVLIVDMGATSTNVVFFDQGSMRFTTSISQGGDQFTVDLIQQLQLSPEVADEKKALVGVMDTAADAAVVNVLRNSGLRLIQEIERVVRQIIITQESGGQEIRAILLSGGSANMPGFPQLFSEVFPNIPVQLGNPWTNVSAPEEKKGFTLSKVDLLHFTTAFGSALRQENHRSYA